MSKPAAKQFRAPTTPTSVGTSSSTGTSDAFALSDHTHGHGAQTNGTLHAAATTTVDGFLSASDKVKINSIAANAAALTSSAPSSIGTANAAGAATTAAKADHVHDHGAQTAATHHALATGSSHGFLSSSDFTKLAAIASGATNTPLASTAPAAIGAAAVGVGTTAARDDHVHAHGNQASSASALHALAVASGNSGFLSGSDKAKIDGIVAGATNTPLSSTTPAAIGTAAIGVGPTAARADHVHGHGVQTDPTFHSLATGSNHGFVSASDFTKLASIATNADVTIAALAAVTSTVAINSQRISGVLDPVNPQDVATKAYADALAQGLDYKNSVRLIQTSTMTLSGTGQTVDGKTVVSGDRVLYAVTGASAGIYVAAAGTWARATDANSSAKVTAGLYTFVSEGTTYGSSGWALATPDPIVLDTTALTFTQFSGAGQINAGTGMTKTGNTFNVIANADGSIVANADDVQVGILATDAQHGTRGGGTTHAAATTSVAGFLSAADKTLLTSLFSSITPASVGTANSAGANTTQVARADHVHAHGVQTDGTLHSLATASLNGFLSSGDFSKLAAIEAAAQVTSFARVQTALGLASSAVAFNAQRLTGAADPTSAQDVATRTFVENRTSGAKIPCRVQLDGPQASLTTMPNVVDGVTLAVGDRVLFKAFGGVVVTGIYEVVTVGTGSNGTWVRATDGDTVGLYSGKYRKGSLVWVIEGTVNAMSLWYCVDYDGWSNKLLTASNIVNMFNAVTPSSVALSNSTGSNVIQAARADHVHAHGVQTDGTLHSLATGSLNGFLSSSDFTKLAGIEAAAQVTSFARVQTALGLASSAVAFNAQRVSSVADPTAAQDAVTRTYAAWMGVGKNSVVAATTVAVDPIGSAPSVVDGISLVVGDRVLHKTGGTGGSTNFNGVYTVTTVGTGANGTWTRATDFDVSFKNPNLTMVYVMPGGTVNGHTIWAMLNPVQFTVQIESGHGLIFYQIYGAGLVTDAFHGARSGGTLHALATASVNGFLSSSDFSKLATVESGAQVTSTARVQTALGLATSATGFNSQRLSTLADPTAAQDAVTRNYAVQMSGFKNAVAAASLFVIDPNAAPNVVDGVTLAVNDRVLLKNGGSGSQFDQNGIYRVVTLGTGANGVWVRASDADTVEKQTNGCWVFVLGGTTQQYTAWQQFNIGQVSIGLNAGTPIYFSQVYGPGALTDTFHGARGGGTMHPVASASVAGFQSAADKAREDRMAPMDANLAYWRSVLPVNPTGAAVVAATTYWVYCGQINSAVTINRVHCYVMAAGTGAMTAAQIAVATTPSAPAAAGQTMTIQAVQTLNAANGTENFTTLGRKCNNTLFAYSPALGAHVWAGVQMTLATAQPTMPSLFQDNSQGHILTSTAATLTVSGTVAASLITPSLAMCPDLSLSPY